MKYLINYADRAYYNSQKLNSQSATIGGFDKVISYNSSDIDKDFKAKNQYILGQQRGAGYWAWKPYLIYKTLQNINDGDFLFYCDAGSIFIRSMNPVIDILDSTKEKILLFELEEIHTIKIWTKRDCLVYMNLDEDKYLNQPQVLGGFIALRKNKFTTLFIEEWLKYSQDPRIITDDPNTCGLDNYPEFKDHRHDQSILSLLARRDNITVIQDPSQWGNGRRTSIPQIIYLHRNKN